VDAFVILAVGSDCNVGKMTAQLTARDELVKRGHKTKLRRHGADGDFFIEGGHAVDAVVADFHRRRRRGAGAAGRQSNDIVLVEDRGA